MFWRKKVIRHEPRPETWPLNFENAFFLPDGVYALQVRNAITPEHYANLRKLLNEQTEGTGVRFVVLPSHVSILDPPREVEIKVNVQEPLVTK